MSLKSKTAALLATTPAAFVLGCAVGKSKGSDCHTRQPPQANEADMSWVLCDEMEGDVDRSSSGSSMVTQAPLSLKLKESQLEDAKDLVHNALFANSTGPHTDVIMEPCRTAAAASGSVETIPDKSFTLLGAKMAFDMGKQAANDPKVLKAVADSLGFGSSALADQKGSKLTAETNNNLEANRHSRSPFSSYEYIPSPSTAASESENESLEAMILKELRVELRGLSEQLENARRENRLLKQRLRAGLGQAGVDNETAPEVEIEPDLVKECSASTPVMRLPALQEDEEAEKSAWRAWVEATDWGTTMETHLEELWEAKIFQAGVLIASVIGVVAFLRAGYVPRLSKAATMGGLFGASVRSASGNSRAF